MAGGSRGDPRARPPVPQGSRGAVPAEPGPRASRPEALPAAGPRLGCRFLLQQWATAGETRRLLSLQYQHSAYTGGAHPNTDYGSLLWERKHGRAITVSNLFLRSAAFETLTRAGYCKALDAERRKRRGTEWKLGLPEFNACPKFAELAIAPVDKNRNGWFDGIDFVASPYTVGPYVEGAYDILLPVTAQLIAAMRPEYRNSFERQRQ